MPRTEPASVARRSARPMTTSKDALDDAERGFDEPMDLTSTNVFAAIAPIDMEVVQMREFEKTAELEAFMEDKIVIQVAETTNENDPWRVFVGVNNDFRWLPRGVPIRIQRKFVEVLAKSQETRYATKENSDRESDDGFRVIKKTAHAYPFQVLEDKHPMARRWLMRMTRGGSQ